VTVDTEKFPKHYPGFDPELWQSEGEWRKYMTILYTGRKIRESAGTTDSGS